MVKEVKKDKVRGVKDKACANFCCLEFVSATILRMF